MQFSESSYRQVVLAMQHGLIVLWLYYRQALLFKFKSIASKLYNMENVHCLFRMETLGSAMSLTSNLVCLEKQKLSQK